jgi:hypothetical protein
MKLESTRGARDFIVPDASISLDDFAAQPLLLVALPAA